jgi:hypothetical protein
MTTYYIYVSNEHSNQSTWATIEMHVFWRNSIKLCLEEMCLEGLNFLFVMVVYINQMTQVIIMRISAWYIIYTQSSSKSWPDIILERLGRA